MFQRPWGSGRVTLRQEGETEHFRIRNLLKADVEPSTSYTLPVARLFWQAERYFEIRFHHTVWSTFSSIIALSCLLFLSGKIIPFLFHLCISTALIMHTHWRKCFFSFLFLFIPYKSKPELSVFHTHTCEYVQFYSFPATVSKL